MRDGIYALRREFARRAGESSGSMRFMRHLMNRRIGMPVLCGVLFFGAAFCGLASAQNSKGSLDISVHVTATGGRPEPVRQFTLYALTKSFADISNEVDSGANLPTRDQFIDGLKVSAKLKEWMKGHDVMDLTAPDLDKVVKPDDIVNVPEFLAAYQRSNSGGVTVGLPTPKFREADKETSPEKYEKARQDYLMAMKKFIQSHPSTVSGMELELSGVNPKLAWDKMHAEHKRKVTQLSPETAQSKYLAGKADTDLEGHAMISGLPPGNYWLSSLGMDGTSGDRRLRWDVPVTVQAGRATRVDLTNVNGTDLNSANP
jgi:hypothetical protein